MTIRIPDTIRQELTGRFGRRVKFDEPMAKHTTFRVGGPADALIMPESENEIAFLVRLARDAGMPLTVIGGGSNILVRDRGIRGMVISLAGCFTGIFRNDQDEKTVRLSVLSGTRLNACCRYALENGLTGLNFALGIPGSVGGAILMNAGASGGCMADVVCGIRVMTEDTRAFDVHEDDLAWSYRELSLVRQPGMPESGGWVILSGQFLMAPADPALLKAEADEIIRYRRSSQPWDQPGAGCFFKNPPEEEPAGKLIEQAGMKGVCLGGAAVSSKHANFIVNRENASADDIIRLSLEVQETVYRRFGVALVPEVRIMGE